MAKIEQARIKSLNKGPFNEGPFCERVSYIRQDYHSEDEIVDILKNTKVNLHNKA